MSSDNEKLSELSKLCYKEQAIWFLNGFFEEIHTEKNEAEKLWDWVEHFQKLDMMGPDKKGAKGNELDVFWSAKFLEDMDKAITAKERKEALKTIDQDNNGKMSLIEYCLWKYHKTVKEVANASQGENEELMAQCQAKIAQVQKAMAEVEAKIEAQKRALASVQDARRENDAKLAQQKIAVQESTSALMNLKRAEAELQKAVDELKAEEEAYAAKIKALEDKIANPATSGMQKAKASNELAQLKGEDPLPLRRAKITAEAAVRKVEKQRKAAEAAKAALEAVERELEATKKQLHEKEVQLQVAIQELENAYEELGREMDEAQAQLTAAKQSGGVAWGAMWFMEREMFEVDSRLPTSKMKYNHKEPFRFEKK